MTKHKTTCVLIAIAALLAVAVAPAQAGEPAPPVVDTIGGPGAGNGQFMAAFGVAVASDGSWFVADYGNDRIQRFTQSGTYVSQFGTSGVGPGQLDGPNGVDIFRDPITHTERIAVADHLNDRVQIFTIGGSWIRTIDTVVGATPTALNKPADVAVGPDDLLYVAERLGDRVLVLELDGTLVREIQNPGPLGLLENPTGVALSPDGKELYVTESDGDRVRVLATVTGGYLRDFGDTALSDPYGVTVDPIGFVYVADSSTIKKYTPLGDLVWSIAGVPGPHHGAIHPQGWHAVGLLGTSTVQVRDLCPDDFTDVPTSHAFFFEICWMATSGVTVGVTEDTYAPTAAVSRQSMAAFLFRLKNDVGFVPPIDPTFPDVPTTHPFYKEIEWLAAEGISEGNLDGTYGPTTTVSRQAMSAFMYRASGEPPFGGPPAPTFSDVPTTHPFYDEIEWMARRGVSTGYPDGTYRPTVAVSRQSMAAFVARLRLLLDLPL
jgi:DNA-binding beta-propeller fold protein YncE